MFIPALTGLRALAALAVVLFHFSRDAELRVFIVDPIISRGYLGVDLILCLERFYHSPCLQGELFSRGQAGIIFKVYSKQVRAYISCPPPDDDCYARLLCSHD